MSAYLHPTWRWEWHPASCSLGSSYPTRVDVSKDDPQFKPRPVGFTAALEPEQSEQKREPEDDESTPPDMPDRWEGDDS